jgi:hypothetical protein
MTPINYPAIPRGVDVGEIIDRTRQGYQDGKAWRAEKEAPDLWLSAIEPMLRGGQPNPPSHARFLAELDPNNGQVQRAGLPPANDPNSARVQQAFTSQGAGSSANTLSGSAIAGRFLKTVRDGGLTNPFALAAVAATGKAESGFDPKNAVSVWSDPSESGQPGMAGGILSLRGPRLAAMQQFAQQNGDDPNAPSPETQGKYLLAEDPSLIQRLQSARSPQEAAQMMADAWRFAGYNRPGGEAASRLADTEAFAPQFGAGQGNSQGAAPSQQALEGLAVGQSAQMPQGAPQQAYGSPIGGSGGSQPQQQQAPDGGLGPGMPDPGTLKALFANPVTRPYAINMAQSRIAAMQDQRDPMKLLAYQKSLLELQQLQSNGGQTIPQGYRKTANGLEAIPGGPADPSNPLNARKTTVAGASAGPDLNGFPAVPLNDSGVPDQAAQAEFLSKLDPSTASLVKGISDYRIPIEKVTSLRGDERQRLAKIVSQYDPNFDMSQYATRSAMRKSVTSGNYSNALNSANLVIQHLDALEKAADDLGNGSYPWLNAGKNLYSKQTGDPAITKFNTIADAAGAELAKVFKGTGATAESEIKAWRSNLDPNASPEQIKASIHTAISDLLKSRLDTISSQYSEAMGRPSDFAFLTPHSREVLKQLGVDPADLDPTTGGGQQGAPDSGADGWQDLGNGIRMRKVQ